MPQAKKPSPVFETISSGSEVSLTDKKKRDEKKERKEEVKKSAAKAK